MLRLQDVSISFTPSSPRTRGSRRSADEPVQSLGPRVRGDDDRKSFIKNFALDIAAGEIVTLMGPSGSGKSSLLSFIGGDLSEAFTATGDIILNDKRLNDVPSEKRRVGRLFQDDLLFPHMTVGENLLFATPRAPQAERIKMMRTVLERADLQGFEDRPPHALWWPTRARGAHAHIARQTRGDFVG
jgi:putative thiamine transport system ATP-binding protein